MPSKGTKKEDAGATLCSICYNSEGGLGRINSAEINGPQEEIEQCQITQTASEEVASAKVCHVVKVHGIRLTQSPVC